MRTITGKIVLPANTPAVGADQVLIEVRDVSLADAPSTVVMERKLTNVELQPSGQIKFRMRVPEVEESRALSLRVHVSLDGSGRVKSGDLLTTAHLPVPSSGPAKSLEVPVTLI